MSSGASLCILSNSHLSGPWFVEIFSSSFHELWWAFLWCVLPNQLFDATPIPTLWFASHESIVSPYQLEWPVWQETAKHHRLSPSIYLFTRIRRSICLFTFIPFFFSFYLSIFSSTFIVAQLLLVSSTFLLYSALFLRLLCFYYEFSCTYKKYFSFILLNGVKICQITRASMIIL